MKFDAQKIDIRHYKKKNGKEYIQVFWIGYKFKSPGLGSFVYDKKRHKWVKFQPCHKLKHPILTIAAHKFDLWCAEMVLAAANVGGHMANPMHDHSDVPRRKGI